MTEHVSNLDNKNKLNKGYKLYKLERYEDALKEFDSAVAINEENMFGEAYLGKGASLSLIGQRESAEEAYGKAINKLCSGAYYNKGLLLSKAGRLCEAHSCYERAIELEPNDPKLYCEWGRSMSFMHQGVKESIKAYDKAIGLDPKHATAYCYKGYALNILEKYDEAIVACDKAIELNPDYAEAYSEKGRALNNIARYEDAIVACDKAIELKPDYAGAYNNKGNTLHNLGRREDAIAAFDKAIELKPDYADAYVGKGCQYNYLEQYDRAINLCNKAIEIDSKCAPAYNNKGYALYELKQYIEAVKAYDKAIELKPDYDDAVANKQAALDAMACQALDKAFEVLLTNTPLSPGARKVATQKIANLKKMQGSNNNDRSYTEKYLNYLFRLPWGKYDKAPIDIIEAKKVLNENHYGLESVKQKIIEALAFMATSKDAKPPILCLVGAPGVGKTSIAKIISKALNRKSVTLSLAGARDEGLIRGCMDFYTGARPGKVLSLLSEVGSSNPVMILDEIDKISKERGSALEGALLQLIDPSQNDSFTDDYFDFGYDMSKVFFIATANSIDNIPYPLLHRMEVIDISGYTDNEKVKITQDYIIPKLMKEVDLPDKAFQISDELIGYIIENYSKSYSIRCNNKIIYKEKCQQVHIVKI